MFTGIGYTFNPKAAHITTWSQPIMMSEQRLRSQSRTQACCAPSEAADSNPHVLLTVPCPLSHSTPWQKPVRANPADVM